MVGQTAHNAAVLAPHLVAQLIKREMGQSDRLFTYHKHKYTPEMISAFILRDLTRGVAVNRDGAQGRSDHHPGALRRGRARGHPPGR